MRCCKFAGELGIAVFDDHLDMLAVECLDLVLECTGDDHILSEIMMHKPPAIGVPDRQASMRMIETAKGYAANPLASTLLKASPDAVPLIDRKLRIMDCNRSFQIRGSANKEEIVGKFCYEVLHGRSNQCRFPRIHCVAGEALETAKPARAIYELRSQNNTSMFRQVTACPILDRHAEILQFVLTLRDVTRDLSQKIEEHTMALKKDFARLAQEDRLTSVGRLVASVCHEINNPITSIVTLNRLVHSILQLNTGKFDSSGSMLLTRCRTEEPWPPGAESTRAPIAFA